MSISRLRIEDITVHNYIKYEVLGLTYVEQETNAALTYDSDLDLYVPDYSDFDPPPNSVGRGWVPFDEVAGVIDVSSEQSTRVSVSGATSYAVDYKNGGIQKITGVPTYASFYWNYVAVIDGWPGVNPPPLPIVAIDIVSSKNFPLQLGPGKITRRDAEFHIFAKDSAERDDLTEAIFDAVYLKQTKLIDYSQGDYLDYDGTFSSTFTSPSVSDTSNIYFDDAITRTVDVASDWSDLNRYRSVVSCTLITYVE